MLGTTAAGGVTTSSLGGVAGCALAVDHVLIKTSAPVRAPTAPGLGEDLCGSAGVGSGMGNSMGRATRRTGFVEAPSTRWPAGLKHRRGLDEHRTPGTG